MVLCSAKNAGWYKKTDCEVPSTNEPAKPGRIVTRECLMLAVLLCCFCCCYDIIGRGRLELSLLLTRTDMFAATQQGSKPEYFIFTVVFLFIFTRKVRSLPYPNRISLFVVVCRGAKSVGRWYGR